MQARGEFVDAVAQAARDPVADVQAIVQVDFGIAVVGGSFAPFQRQVAEGVGGIRTELGQAGRKILAVPEILRPAGMLLELHDVQCLDEDDDPRGQ